ncbi:MAG: hypothetical protein AAGL49_13115, partial [Pseudomonadota bacterium]
MAVGAAYTERDKARAVAHAKAYPFDVPAEDYVFAGGQAVPLAAEHRDYFRRPSDEALDRLRERVGGAAAARLADGAPRHAVVACGSNAAPSRLKRKFADRPEAGADEL